MALEALARRESDTDLVSPLLTGINQRGYWQRWFALRTLDARVREALIGTVLTSIDDTWLEPFLLATLADFIEEPPLRGPRP